MVSTQHFDCCDSGSNPDAVVKREIMIDATLLIDMMAKYIQENGIKELMKCVMKAIEVTKDN